MTGGLPAARHRRCHPANAVDQGDPRASRAGPAAPAEGTSARGNAAPRMLSIACLPCRACGTPLSMLTDGPQILADLVRRRLTFPLEATDL